MQEFEVRVMGRSSGFTAGSGRVGEVTRREVRRRRLLAASGPPVEVSDFWVMDSASRRRLEAKAVPGEFGVRSGQTVTLLFGGRRAQGSWLRGARNNSTNQHLLIAPRRPRVFWALLWLLLGWIGFWAAELTLPRIKTPVPALILLVLWALVGTWLLVRSRILEARLDEALSDGGSELALLGAQQGG